MAEMNLGEQKRRLRNSKKLTLAVMAERVGVTTSAIAAYENGSRTPSLDVLVRIARLFHVSVDNILGYSNKYTIDITGLTQKQRNTIHEVVSVFKRHNVMYRDFMESGSIVNELKDMGLVDKFED